MMPRLFNPLKVGRLELKNRIVMPPIGGLHYNSVDGEVTDYLLMHYSRRARGLGLLIVEASRVGRHGGWLGIYDDRFIPGLRKLVDQIHGHGTPAAIQLTRRPTDPKELTHEEIEILVEAFFNV